MKIYLVEVHYHYESSEILSAHMNKDVAYNIAMKEGIKNGCELVMKGQPGNITVCDSYSLSLNVIEIELDERTYFEPTKEKLK